MKAYIHVPLLGVAMFLGARDAFAVSSFRSKIPNGTVNSCSTCHDLNSGPPALNPFGMAFFNAGTQWTPALAALDSDGDGFSNGQELGDPAGTWTPGAANPGGTITNPGDPSSHPAITAPSITTQPVSQTVDAGANVTFSVEATGTAPLTYQWRKDTADIAGATNVTLNLTHVGTGDAGSYVVVVSNAADSVSSTPAILIVNELPVKLLISLNNQNSAVISWPGSSVGYVLQENSDPGGTNWVEATNAVSVVNEMHQVTISPLADKRFYRLAHP